jgi:hypothetical protein
MLQIDKKTKRPIDFNFDSYVQVTYKIIENEPYITLTDIYIQILSWIIF